MGFRSRRSRAAFSAALFVLLVLIILFGIDAAVSIPVRSRLSKLDGFCTFEGLRFAPGRILLRNLHFPERGLFLRNCVVYWSGSPFAPVVDSLLVEGGRWNSSGEQGENTSETEAGSSLPSCRFSGIDLISGEDTATVCGRYVNDGFHKIVSL
ncbi:MAG: hypothetical protein GF388_09970, partial [Candidatus Aegiribacteria sp.]|nr:hypothetical protein [Candidatus Aegiribacteria sp.]MBD3295359.1 hypothetical protein [Candidatus Fermentibacteria bacterium]